jgi:copper chaperone
MKATIKIQNLKCSGCENTITSNLKKIKSISAIKINQEEDLITFEYEEAAALKKAKSSLKKLGYPEVGEENKLGTKSKSYVSCAIGKLTK